MPFDLLRAPQRPRTRRLIQRMVFICRHPLFQEQERMLSQELFEPRFFRDQRRAYNECNATASPRKTANRAIDRLLGQCDFVQLREIGTLERVKGLSEFDVACIIFRLEVKERQDFILRKIPADRLIAVPPAVAHEIAKNQMHAPPVTNRPKRRGLG